MNGVPGLFPNASPTGDSIPFDLLFPTAVGVVDFLTSVSGEVILPAGSVILSLRSTADCYINFGVAASIPVSGSFVDNQVYVQVDEVVHIVAPYGALTVIGETAAGRLTIQVSQPWTAVKVAPNSHAR